MDYQHFAPSRRCLNRRFDVRRKHRLERHSGIVSEPVCGLDLGVVFEC
jgi:hypothetical protein